jgi:intraflagellar transport protein 43
MSQGWGFSKENNVRMNTNQVVEKKKEAFWEAANDNVIVVPDIDAETEAIQQDVSNPMGLEVEKLVDFYDMQIETRKSTLPATEEGVDLSLLLSMIRTSEELQEKDEPWEFSKLKTEVYELVSKLNRPL